MSDTLQQIEYALRHYGECHTPHTLSVKPKWLIPKLHCRSSIPLENPAPRWRHFYATGENDFLRVIERLENSRSVFVGWSLRVPVYEMCVFDISGWLDYAQAVLSRSWYPFRAVVETGMFLALDQFSDIELTREMARSDTIQRAKSRAMKEYDFFQDERDEAKGRLDSYAGFFEDLLYYYDPVEQAAAAARVAARRRAGEYFPCSTGALRAHLIRIGLSEDEIYRAIRTLYRDKPIYGPAY